MSHDSKTIIPKDDPTKARLDHIIVLLPYKDLLCLPEWITSNFTITPGGQHADKKTENKLILFFDGSYVELIAFINDDPKNKEGHWWGKKEPGVIDYALTTTGEAKAHWEALQSRLSGTANGDYSYDRPVAGGRLRPDGIEVKWEVTFPVGVQRGELPFFCHDVTPRDRRVPFSETACTHPCGAYGVKRLVVSVPEDKVSSLKTAYSAVLGQDEDTTGGVLDTVRKVEGAPHPALDISAAGEKETAVVKAQGVVLGPLILRGFAEPGGFEGKKRLDAGEDYGGVVLDVQPPSE